MKTRSLWAQGFCGSVSGTEDLALRSLICHSVITEGKSYVILGEVILNFLAFFFSLFFWYF